MADRLVVRGAREHNLKDVSLDLPRDALIVFTGLSGSGKSSLAFDTIFAEGQRRYVESLSAYARQFLGQMDKPDVDFIEGLSPAVSIDQKSTNRNPRSTVGTITEVYDYLRLLFARAGTPHCPKCGRVIARQQPSQIVDRVLELEEGSRFQVLAPVIRERKGEYVDLFADLQTKGFSRVRVDGVVHSLTDVPKLKKQEKHTIEVVVDRLQVKESSKRRLTDSVETALQLGNGLVTLDFVDLPEDDPHRQRTFSEHLACLFDDLSFEELEPRSFSFNSPFGACTQCHGLGIKKEVDPELVVPDADKTLGDGAIYPWSSGHNIEYFGRLITALGDALGFTLKTRWRDLTGTQQEALLHGHETEVHVRYRNRYGRERSYYTAYEGVVPFLERRHSEAESESSRDRYEGYMREVPCPACLGARLKPEVLAVTLSGKSIAEIAALSIAECAQFLRSLVLDDRQRMIAERVLKEVNERMGFLLDVGLDYLSLDRAAGTSGSRPRSAPAWWACSTCSTSPASASTSATTGVSSTPSSGCATWATRSSSSSTTRTRSTTPTGSSTSARERGSTAARWSSAAPCRTCSTRPTPSPGPTSAADARSPCRRPAGRATPSASWASSGPASTTCAPSTSTSRSGSWSPSPG
jgi:excinuclease ABC subunit A